MANAAPSTRQGHLSDGPKGYGTGLSGGTSVAQGTHLVHQGYLIRTRADSDTKEARTNDTARRDAVLASGAQIISTDYPSSEPATTGYQVELPGNAVARCNPLIKPTSCVDSGFADDK